MPDSPPAQLRDLFCHDIEITNLLDVAVVHDWLEQFIVTVADPVTHDSQPRRRGRPTKQEARARR